MTAIYKFKLFLLSILLTGCCLGVKDEYKYVSKEHKLVYEVGDILIYMSNQGNFDTLKILDVTQSFLTEEINYNCNAELYKEKLTFDFFHSKQNILDYPHLIQHRGGENIFIWLNGYLYEFFYEGEHDYENIFINEHQYQYVFERDMPTRILSDHHSDSGIVTKNILFNKTEGLIRYELENGEVWSLLRIVKN